LVTFSERDLDVLIETRQHRWDGDGALKPCIID
jgi:hypothetical protein